MLTVAEAIWTFTMGGAFAGFEENDKGSIRAGKLADFVILEDDPRETDPFALKDVEVTATYVGGVAVYEH